VRNFFGFHKRVWEMKAMKREFPFWGRYIESLEQQRANDLVITNDI